VLAHELAHEAPDILISSVAATLAAAVMMISRFAMFSGGGRRSGGPESGSRCWRRSSGADRRDVDPQRWRFPRSREFDADAGNAAIAATRGALVSAPRNLKRIQARAARRQSGHGAHVHHRRSRSPGLTSLFSTHPPTGERIQALHPARP
jgi:heat shock protein HtpX